MTYLISTPNRLILLRALNNMTLNIFLLLGGFASTLLGNSCGINYFYVLGGSKNLIFFSKGLYIAYMGE